MTTMVDGISPDVPAILQRWGSGTPVACYVNGIYAWTYGQEHEFARKIRVSVEAGQPTAAHVARVLDVERGAARPADVEPFCAARIVAGHEDATIYANLSTVAAIPANVRELVPRWWLAWYWQRPGAPTAAQVLAQLARLYNVSLPPERLWACQHASYSRWDVSVVYGQQDWSR